MWIHRVDHVVGIATEFSHQLALSMLVCCASLKPNDLLKMENKSKYDFLSLVSPFEENRKEYQGPTFHEKCPLISYRSEFWLTWRFFPNQIVERMLMCTLCRSGLKRSLNTFNDFIWNIFFQLQFFCKLAISCYDTKHKQSNEKYFANHFRIVGKMQFINSENKLNYWCKLQKFYCRKYKKSIGFYTFFPICNKSTDLLRVFSMTTVIPICGYNSVSCEVKWVVHEWLTQFLSCNNLIFGKNTHQKNPDFACWIRLMRVWIISWIIFNAPKWWILSSDSLMTTQVILITYLSEVWLKIKFKFVFLNL